MTKFASAVAALALTLLVGSPSASADFLKHKDSDLNELVVLHIMGTIMDGKSVAAGEETVNYHGHDQKAYSLDLGFWSDSSGAARTSYQTLQRGQQVAWLYSAYAPQVNSNRDAAALSVALWELVYESSNALDVANGYFSISGNNAVAQAASRLLSSLPETYSNDTSPILLGNGTTPSLIAAGDAVVPEPATLALLLGGAATFICRARRR